MQQRSGYSWLAIGAGTVLCLRCGGCLMLGLLAALSSSGNTPFVYTLF